MSINLIPKKLSKEEIERKTNAINKNATLCFGSIVAVLLSFLMALIYFFIAGFRGLNAPISIRDLFLVYVIHWGAVISVFLGIFVIIVYVTKMKYLPDDLMGRADKWGRYCYICVNNLCYSCLECSFFKMMCRTEKRIAKEVRKEKEKEPMQKFNITMVFVCFFFVSLLIYMSYLEFEKVGFSFIFSSVQFTVLEQIIITITALLVAGILTAIVCPFYYLYVKISNKKRAKLKELSKKRA